MSSMTYDSFSAMDAVVLVALICAVVFVVAWAVSPALRVRIERPKYSFQKRLRKANHE
jgi:hypothetical protein